MIAHPSLVYFAAGILCLYAHKKTRQLLQIFVPFAALYLIISGIKGPIHVMSMPLMGHLWPVMRMDSLSLLFAYAFVAFSLFANLFSLHVESKWMHAAAQFYVGGALGAVFAGDLILLFIFWEIMAVASAILIWDSSRPSSLNALYRYLLVHTAGGLCFFAAVMIEYSHGNSLLVSADIQGLSGWLLFAAFAINAALFPVHAWLPDAYASASPAASVYLSAFTTKTAVYAFARFFPGDSALLVLAAVSAVYGVVFALMENDIRKILSYHMICQIGYMLAGIALGTELGVSGGTGHAIGNVLFKGLLFMCAASIVFMTGKGELSDLGGLKKHSRFLFCMYAAGALAIAGLPLLNGYVTKSLLVASAAESHKAWLEALLLTVSAGTFLSIGLKAGYFIFFSKPEKNYYPKPLPWNAAAAMLLCAVSCLFIGLFPSSFFAYLPHDIQKNVFSASHILQTLSLLAGTWLYFMLTRKKLHTERHDVVDLDWFYRKASSAFVIYICGFYKKAEESVQARLRDFLSFLYRSSETKIPAQNVSPAGYPLMWILMGAAAAGAVFLIGFL